LRPKFRHVQKGKKFKLYIETVHSSRGAGRLEQKKQSQRERKDSTGKKKKKATDGDEVPTRDRGSAFCFLAK